MKLLADNLVPTQNRPKLTLQYENVYLRKVKTLSLNSVIYVLVRSSTIQPNDLKSSDVNQAFQLHQNICIPQTCIPCKLQKIYHMLEIMSIKFKSFQDKTYSEVLVFMRLWVVMCPHKREERF